MQKVLVFGTFDGLHDGHRSMLKEAKSLGSYLIAAVAPDDVVKQLKGATSSSSAAQRIAMLKAERLADEVILGDSALNSWNVIKKYKPAIIALGYDQHELKQNLEEYLEKAYPEVETEEGWQSNPKKPKIVILSAHKPDKYHNRILHS